MKNPEKWKNVSKIAGLGLEPKFPDLLSSALDYIDYTVSLRSQ